MTHDPFQDCNLFFGANPVPPSFDILLNGIQTIAYPSHSHFKDFNVLGAEFCASVAAFTGVDYQFRKAKLIFKSVPSPVDISLDG